MLVRPGNKTRLSKIIVPLFPEHTIYYEPFFGAGGMFFNKKAAKYSILNDNDSDVFNLFLVVKDKPEELKKLWGNTPFSEELFYYWYYTKESDPIKSAVRFLYLSNLSYLGKSDTFLLQHSNAKLKSKLEQMIYITSEMFKNSMLRNQDFRNFYDDIIAGNLHIPKSKRFIYADPPYLGTSNNYETTWTKKDAFDNIDTLIDSGIRFAMSEYDHKDILSYVKEKNLNIFDLGTNVSLKTKKKEILITNYDIQNSLFQTLNKI